MKVDWILTAKGDGYWGMKDGDKIRISEVVLYHHDNEEFGKLYYSIIKGNKDSLPYTDQGILDQLHKNMTGYKTIGWTEQGMQGEDYIHVILDGVW